MESKLTNIIVDSSWAKVGSGLVGAYALALDAYYDGMQDIARERRVEHGKYEILVAKDDDDDDDDRLEHRSSFTVGVLVGIGISFGCLLLTSVLGHGGGLIRQRR